MAQWIRIDVLLHDHPKIVELGPHGLAVILAAWRLCKAHGSRGELPAAFWTPSMLARWTLYGTAPEALEAITLGMTACEQCGLVTHVTRDGRDKIAFHDWDDYQQDTTAAERQRRHREAVSTRKSIPVTRDGRDVTPVTAVTGTGQDIHTTPLPPVGGEGGIPDDPVPGDVRLDAIRETFRRTYDAHYGHPPLWNRKDTDKARTILAYLHELATSWNRPGLSVEGVERALTDATTKFLAEDDDLTRKSQHSFAVFVSRFQSYVPRRRSA